MYYTRKEFYSFDSWTGTVNCLNDEIYVLMSVFLTLDFLLHDTWHLDRLDGRGELPGLGADQVYALLPNPAPGVDHDEMLAAVDMREHLAALARSFDHKVKQL